MAGESKGSPAIFNPKNKKGSSMFSTVLAWFFLWLFVGVLTAVFFAQFAGVGSRSPRINHSIKRIATAIFLSVVIGVSAAAVARADGYLTDAERHIGDELGSSICQFFSALGVNTYSMSKAIRIIYVNTPSYMDETDAQDIIQYAVLNYCPATYPAIDRFINGVNNVA